MVIGGLSPRPLFYCPQYYFEHLLTNNVLYYAFSMGIHRLYRDNIA